MSIDARFCLQRGEFHLDVDVTLPGEGVTAVFGASGAGKSTLLRCVAGLERAAQGVLSVNGEVWQREGLFLPVHRRPLGVVFQESSLFPHLTGAGNLRFGLQRTPIGERCVGWDEVVQLLGIAPLLPRYPDSLSGGERQRIALARALLASPQLLLLDEPLAALDEARKAEILPFLERLRTRFAMPMLYVTHSMREVARLADYLVLLEGGRVRAQGPVQEMLSRLDLSLAAADDAGVVIDAVVAEHDAQWHLSRLSFPGGSLWVSRCAEPPGERLRCRVLARDVSLTRERNEQSSIVNLVAAEVVELAPAASPAHVMVRLDAQGTPLLARITRQSQARIAVQPGECFWLQIKSVALLR
jgi:molybdate transport system ATP-binding protein